MNDFTPRYFYCYLFDNDETSQLIYRVIYDRKFDRDDPYTIQYSRNNGATWTHDGSYRNLYDSVKGILIHLYSREKHGKPTYRNINAESFELKEIYAAVDRGINPIAIIGDHPSYDLNNTFDTAEELSVRLYDLVVHSKF